MGLAVLQKKGTVLKCYSNMAETVTYSEIGMSMAILEAGYNIDTLMLRYQVGTRSPEAWHHGWHVGARFRVRRVLDLHLIIRHAL